MDEEQKPGKPVDGMVVEILNAIGKNKLLKTHFEREIYAKGKLPYPHEMTAKETRFDDLWTKIESRFKINLIPADGNVDAGDLKQLEEMIESAARLMGFEDHEIGMNGHLKLKISHLPGFWHGLLILLLPCLDKREAAGSFRASGLHVMGSHPVGKAIKERFERFEIKINDDGSDNQRDGALFAHEYGHAIDYYLGMRIAKRGWTEDERLRNRETFMSHLYDKDKTAKSSLLGQLFKDMLASRTTSSLLRSYESGRSDRDDIDSKAESFASIFAFSLESKDYTQHGNARTICQLTRKELAAERLENPGCEERWNMLEELEQVSMRRAAMA